MTLKYLVGRRNYSNTPWNAECDAVLTKLWLEGYSAAQIAGQIVAQVTRCAVIARAHRLKLPARRPAYPARKRFGSVPKLAPPRPQPPPEPPPPSAPAMRRLSLLELERSHCHWPIGDPMAFFCAADAVSGAIYCPFHQRMARR